jgi:hypothetical protein
MSRYMGTIPLSGEGSCAAEQIISALPVAAVSSAMIPNVGAAARDNQWEMPMVATSPEPPADLPPVAALSSGRLDWKDIETSTPSVLIMVAPPDTILVAPLRGTVEPLIHAPEAVQPARIAGIGVIYEAIVEHERTEAGPVARKCGDVGSG